MRQLLRRAAIVVLAVALTHAVRPVSSPAVAATLTWWSGGSGGAAGGAGTWDTTGLQWTADGSAWSAWSNAATDTAVLGGASAGTVTLGTGITAGGITFATTGYTVSGNTLTLAGGTATIDAAATSATIGSAIAGSALLTKIGSGTLTLTGNNSYSGNTVIDAGAVIGSGDPAYNGGRSPAFGTGSITVNNALITGATERAVGGGSATTRALTLNSGTWNLNYALAGGEYVQNLTMTAGQVTTSNGAWFRAPTGFAITTLASSATSVIAPRLDLTFSDLALDVADGAAAIDLTMSGTITENSGAGTGAKSIAKTGAGTVSFGAANTYTGTTTVSAGRIVLGANTSLGTGQVVLNGGSIQRDAADVTVANAIAVNAGGGTIVGRTSAIDGYVTLSGPMTGSGTVSLQGLVAVTSTASTYSGTISLATGTTYLRFSANGGLGSSASLNAGPGFVRVDAPATATVANFSGSNQVFGVRNGADQAARFKVTGTGAFSGTIINNDALLTLEKSGTGTFTLNRGTTNGVIAGVVVSGGTLQLAGAGRLFNGTGYFGGAQPITVTAGGVLASAADFNTNSAVITLDGGTLTFTNGGASDSSNYANSVTLRNGAAVTGNAPRLGYLENAVYTVSGTSASSITSNIGLLYNAGNTGLTATFNVADVTSSSAADLTITGVIADQIAGLPVVKSGSGTLRLTAANTYDGGTTIRAGSIVAANSSAVGDSGTITLNDASTGSSDTSLLIDASGATVTISRAITVANQGTGAATLGSSANAGGNFATFSGPITLAKSVTLTGVAAGDRTSFTGGISGTGNVTVTTSGGGRMVFLTTANSYSGSTTITSASRLQLGDGGASGTSFLPDGSSITVDGFLNLAKGGNSETVDALFGAGTVQAIAGGDTLVVGSAGGSGTFSGVLQNGGSTLAFTKTGAGRQVLSGTSTHTGATSVAAGTLAVNGRLANTSSLSVAAAAFLTGYGSANAAVSGAGTVGPGGSPGILTVTAVNPTGGLDFTFEFSSTGSPAWSAATASVNDVLRLTSGTAFSSSLTSANAVNVYLDVTSVTAGDVFQGGFYTDAASAFDASIAGATYAYFVKGDGNGTAATYNGTNYYALDASYLPGFTGVTVSTVQVPTASFASGSVSNGYVSQMIVVPEPTAAAGVGVAAAMAAAVMRRRRPSGG